MYIKESIELQNGKSLIVGREYHKIFIDDFFEELKEENKEMYEISIKKNIRIVSSKKKDIEYLTIRVINESLLENESMCSFIKNGSNYTLLDIEYVK